jgi:hypothetical protein
VLRVYHLSTSQLNLCRVCRSQTNATKRIPQKVAYAEKVNECTPLPAGAGRQDGEDVPRREDLFDNPLQAAVVGAGDFGPPRHRAFRTTVS